MLESPGESTIGLPSISTDSDFPVRMQWRLDAGATSADFIPSVMKKAITKNTDNAVPEIDTHVIIF